MRLKTMTGTHLPIAQPPMRLRHGAIEAAWFSDAAACIEVMPLGATAVVCIQGEACSGEVISQAHGGSAFEAVGMVLDGSLRMGQARATMHLQPGQAFLWSSRHSGRFEASHGLRLMQLLVPADHLGSRWPSLVSDEQPRRAEAPDWAMDMAHAGLQTLWRHRGEWPAQDLADAAASVLDLLSRSLRKPRIPQATRLQELVAQIDASLGDPALGPAWLSRRLGISRRSLYALTDRYQTTVRELIRRRRLEGCRAQLLSAGPQARIADIAASHGFSDPARFSKVFKAEFGMQPREFRRLQSRGE